MKLFDLVVEQDKLHPNFVNTIAENSVGVRKVIEAWASGLKDRDGKFVREFQTTYNSSFWEIYLFAVLKHLGIEVNLSYPAPDFVCDKPELIIEAAIASHAQDDVPEWEKTFQDIIGDEDLFEIYRHSIIRLSNTFHSKYLKYREDYAKLNHVKAKPFVIAISNYTRPDFNLHGDVPMQWLLYDIMGLGSVKKKNGADVPLGLFSTDQYSDVSAVLYSSLATFGKARALGGDVGNFMFVAVRIKDNFTPIRIVKNKEEYNESLCDGLRLFVNPFAKHPVNIAAFDDDGIRKFVPDKRGNIDVSCHPDGDLCMRIVHHVMQRQRG